MFKVGENLYTIDSKGATRLWRIEVDGDRYRTVAGIVGGVETCSGWTTAVGKNIGRSNETTAEEQAYAEAYAEYKKKVDRKYHTSIDNVGSHKFIAPMLAHKYEGWNGMCFAQPKLDGIRCIATKNGLTSRQGKPFMLGHIERALEPIFDRYPDLVLDGELYNHRLHDDFNKITSLVKKQTRSPEEEAECERLVQYHVYDIVDSLTSFAYRTTRVLSITETVNSDVIQRVDTLHVASAEGLDQYYTLFLEEGYEGQIIRYDEKYEIGKRSKNLLKRKEFQDEEFELVSVSEGNGNWAGYAKTCKLRMADGRTFDSGIKGDQAFTKWLLDNWKQYGATTVRYFQLTPDGIPRFPVAVAWHESVTNRD